LFSVKHETGSIDEEQAMTTDIIRTAQTRSQQIAACLDLLRDALPIQRRVGRASRRGSAGAPPAPGRRVTGSRS
jgi:hypothetical protein